MTRWRIPLKFLYCVKIVFLRIIFENMVKSTCNFFSKRLLRTWASKFQMRPLLIPKQSPVLRSEDFPDGKSLNCLHWRPKSVEKSQSSNKHPAQSWGQWVQQNHSTPTSSMLDPRNFPLSLMGCTYMFSGLLCMELMGLRHGLGLLGPESNAMKLVTNWGEMRKNRIRVGEGEQHVQK